MLDHIRVDRWKLGHLVKQRIWILISQQGTAAVTGIRVVFHPLIHLIDWQQVRPIAGMAWLVPRLRPVPLQRPGGLNKGPLLEGNLEDLRELGPIRSRRLASHVCMA